MNYVTQIVGFRSRKKKLFTKFSSRTVLCIRFWLDRKVVHNSLKSTGVISFSVGEVIPKFDHDIVKYVHGQKKLNFYFNKNSSYSIESPMNSVRVKNSKSTETLSQVGKSSQKCKPICVL